MLYHEFIQNILDTRGRFNIPKDEYKERHHIIPKCMGGTDDEENLIDLYAREHFTAHKLLAEENPDNSGLVWAYWNMCTLNKCHKIITAEEYELARKTFSDSISGDRHPDVKGNKNPMFGKINYGRRGKPSWTSGKKGIYSEETLEKFRTPKSEQAKQNMRHKHNVSDSARKVWGMTGKKFKKRIILCVTTNTLYESVSSVCREFNITRHSLLQHLSGVIDTINGNIFKEILND